MKVTDLGEFGLIDRWARSIGPSGGNVVVGIGDDAAVLEFPAGSVLVATCDVMIEDVHFVLGGISPEQIGVKAMAMNLSDIAAMNARPLYALVTVGLKGDLDVDFVDRLYEGLTGTARRFGCDIVGGDTVNSPRGLVVDVFVMGAGERGRMTQRSGARPGDVVMVTGCLGASAAGLELILSTNRGSPARVSPVAASEVTKAHLEPVPRLREAWAISAAGGANAAIDVSDGLANEVNHLARLSGVQVVIDASEIPINDSTKEVARASGRDPLDFALFGGEDYELCFTTRPENAERIVRRVAEETGTRVTVIGRVLEGRGAWIARDGRPEILASRAYDHFKRDG